MRAGSGGPVVWSGSFLYVVGIVLLRVHFVVQLTVRSGSILRSSMREGCRARLATVCRRCRAKVS
jgi:hypothetical protein